MAEFIEPHSLPRREDERFLTGSGRFTADLHLDGALHAALLRSEHPHACVDGIDARAAQAMPDVVAVHTAQDLAADGIGPLPCVAQLSDGSPLVIPERHALAGQRVRHVGDPVALVLARSRQAALDALEGIAVDYRPLPAVTDARRAVRPGAEQLWPQAAGNLAFHFRRGDADATAAAFAAAAHVVELDIANHRVSALPLEPRAGVAEYDPAAERYTLTATVQGVHEIRAQAAEPVFGLPADRLRIKAPDVGGGFGLKNFLYPEWVLLMWAARRHGCPVQWVADRGEEPERGRPRTRRARERPPRSGRGRHLSCPPGVVRRQHGCLPLGSGPAITTKALPTALGGCYAIPCMYMESRGVFTNTAPVDAYRGAGKPEANFIIERLIDAAARRCGFDAVELRRRNMFRAFPHRTAFGMDIDGGRFAENVDRALRLADREGFAARRADSAARGRLRGFGVGCFLETSRGVPSEGAEVRFREDGTVELRVGTESNGQGHETAFAQIASALLGLPMDTFRFVQADTARTRWATVTAVRAPCTWAAAPWSRRSARCWRKRAHWQHSCCRAMPGTWCSRGGGSAVPASGRGVGLLEVAEGGPGARRGPGHLRRR